MLEIFQSQIPVTLEKLEESYKEKDFDGFYFEIHRIKSTIGIVGLPQLFELAMILEKETYGGANGPNVSEYFDKFKKQVAEDILLVETELERLNEPVT